VKLARLHHRGVNAWRHPPEGCAEQLLHCPLLIRGSAEAYNSSDETRDHTATILRPTKVRDQAQVNSSIRYRSWLFLPAQCFIRWRQAWHCKRFDSDHLALAHTELSGLVGEPGPATRGGAEASLPYVHQIWVYGIMAANQPSRYHNARVSSMRVEGRDE